MYSGDILPEYFSSLLSVLTSIILDNIDTSVILEFTQSKYLRFFNELISRYLRCMNDDKSDICVLWTSRFVSVIDISLILCGKVEIVLQYLK
jgi:hypothetical protein